MKVCICGGGSQGHVCAAVLGSRNGVSVNILTTRPERWQARVCADDADGVHYESSPEIISSDPSEAVAGCDVVLLCLPGYAIEEMLMKIRPHIKGSIVGSIVSSTGFFFFAHKLLQQSVPLFGFKRTPYIARVREYGACANILGGKPSIDAVFENVQDRMSLKTLLESLFFTKINILDSYLEVSLSNSNPILHTGRLYSLFKGKEDDVFDECGRFYADWDDESSKIEIAMDRELFAVLSSLNITSMKTLLDYYDSSDARSLTMKLRSIKAFSSITCPMIQREGGGWIIDRSSRYFTEDFPFGLRWIKEIAEMQGVPTPVIDEVYAWGLSLI